MIIKQVNIYSVLYRGALAMLSLHELTSRARVEPWRVMLDISIHPFLVVGFSHSVELFRRNDTS